MNGYNHILKGAEVFINEGRKRTEHINMPNGYTFAESLLYEVGTAEGAEKQALLERCKTISIELASRR